MRSSFTSATESTDGTNRQPINRELFHLRTVNEIRASLAKRDRNAWLYSYNPLKLNQFECCQWRVWTLNTSHFKR